MPTGVHQLRSIAWKGGPAKLVIERSWQRRIGSDDSQQTPPSRGPPSSRNNTLNTFHIGAAQPKRGLNISATKERVWHFADARFLFLDLRPPGGTD
jgi:hypothetical protein